MLLGMFSLAASMLREIFCVRFIVSKFSVDL